MPKSFFFLVCTLLFFAGSCAHSPFGPPAIQKKARFSLYYNDPGRDRQSMANYQIERELFALLDQAKQSICLAAYNLDLPGLAERLQKAKERGVVVRLVGDIDEMHTSGYYDFMRRGLDFRLGNAAGIQHNKFVVVDDRLVFAGTGNFSSSDFLHNNNNFVIIEDRPLAFYYRQEFEQMYAGLFGHSKRPFSENHDFVVNGSRVSVYFSPYDGEAALQRLVDLVDSARQSVHYMIFSFSHDDLAAALTRAARQRNILVKGIHDSNFLVGSSQEAGRLYQAGLEPDGRHFPMGPLVLVDGNENYLIPGNFSHGAKMHCKTMIIDAGTDHAILVTGSFNWSASAVNDNDENLLVIEDAAAANFVYQQFLRAEKIAHDPGPGLSLGHGQRVASQSPVIISEIGWSGSSAGSIDYQDIFVELYNQSSQPVDLSNWSLQWGADVSRHYYAVPDENSGGDSLGNLLQPGSYRVFTAKYSAWWGQKIPDNYGFSFADQLQAKVRLFDPLLWLADESQNDWPAATVDALARQTISLHRRNLPGRVLPGFSRAAWSQTLSFYSQAPYGSFSRATAGYANGSEESPRLLAAKLVSDRSLLLHFNSDMSNCLQPAAFANDFGGQLIAVEKTSDPAILQLQLASPLADPATVYGLSLLPSCQDFLLRPAAGTVFVNGYSGARARLWLHEVGLLSGHDYVELRVETAGSLQGIRLLEYSEKGARLLYEFGEMQVQAGDLLLVETGYSLAEEAASDDRVKTRNTPCYRFYSAAENLGRQDTVLLLASQPPDLLYFSNHDGYIYPGLVKLILRQLGGLWQLPQFPVSGYNDRETQGQAVAISNLPSGFSLQRKGSKSTEKNDWFEQMASPGWP